MELFFHYHISNMLYSLSFGDTSEIFTICVMISNSLGYLLESNILSPQDVIITKINVT